MYDFIFMYPAIALLLNFCCVAHFNDENVLHRLSNIFYRTALFYNSLFTVKQFYKKHTSINSHLPGFPLGAARSFSNFKNAPVSLCRQTLLVLTPHAAGATKRLGADKNFLYFYLTVT